MREPTSFRSSAGWLYLPRHEGPVPRIAMALLPSRRYFFIVPRLSSAALSGRLTIGWITQNC